LIARRIRWSLPSYAARSSVSALARPVADEEAELAAYAAKARMAEDAVAQNDGLR
jgi:hypothetical protein